ALRRSRGDVARPRPPLHPGVERVAECFAGYRFGGQGETDEPNEPGFHAPSPSSGARTGADARADAARTPAPGADARLALLLRRLPLRSGLLPAPLRGAGAVGDLRGPLLGHALVAEPLVLLAV